jgi:hypothetical protein
MKRFHVIGLALLAIFAVGTFGALSAVAHKKKKKVATSVTIAFNLGDPVGPPDEYDGYKKSSFSGKVGSTKPVCVKGRTVVVTRVGGATIGEDKTATDGSWTVDPKNTPVTAGGQYTATVLKQKIVKRKNKKHKHVIKCLPVSETITIPTP